MPAKLRLSPKLSMPADAITRTFGIFGQRGTGKSTTGAVLVEQGVHVGGRAVVLDPTGVWYGLTREGTGPGLPGVVLGGEFADGPLEPEAGKLVAEFVIGSDYPLVVLDMKLMRKHQRQHFAMEFLEALYHDNRDPLLVIFDEAAQFAPTHMREGGDLPRLLGAVEDLVKLGRSRGLGAVMIEQRIATLNANVREQIETLVAHRLVGPLDRKALKEWIAAQGEPEREAEALEAISKLAPGTALVWSPAFLKFFGEVDVDNATTFDSRATPEVGKKRKAPTKRAPVDLDTLREQMAATIEEAERNDPTKLRQQVQRLERDLAAQKIATDTLARRRDDLERALEKRPTEPARVEVPVLTDKQIERVEQIIAKLDRDVGTVDNVATTLRTVSEGIRIDVIEAVRNAAAARPPAEPVEREGRQRALGAPAARPPARPPAPQTASSNGSSISGPQQAILDAIAWFEAVGVPAPRKPPLAAVAGVSSKSSGFRANLSTLSGKGLVSYPGHGRVALTDQGRDQAHPPAYMGSPTELQEAVYRMVSGPQADLLRQLVTAYPDPLDRETLAERAGVSPLSSGFRANVSTLSGFELLTYPAPGQVKAAPLLFLEDAAIA